MSVTSVLRVVIAALAASLVTINHAQAQTLLCTIDAVVTGSFSGACGNSSLVTGNYDFASGYLSKITGNNSAAYGAYSFAGGDNAVAIGARSTATNASPYSGTSNATAVGAYSVSGVGGAAVGAYATASGTDAIAYGHSALADQSQAMALGVSAQARAANAIAIGPNASATASGAIAIGSGSVADLANTVSVGASGAERKIVNLANGTLSATSKDAVNGGQLFATNSSITANTSSITTLNTGLATANTNFATANQRIAAAFGGGSGVDANGIVTAPSYTLFGGTYSNVGSALGAIETRTNTNTSDISSIWTQLGNGSVGLVRQNSVSRDITVAALTDGTNMSIAGTAGARKLTGLRNGTIAANSADAVTGSQLNDTNTAVASNASSVSALTTSVNGLGTNFLTSQQRIAAAFGGGSGVDLNGVATAPSYTLFGNTYTNVGSALGAVETRTNTNTSDINSIWNQLGNGSVGLVRQNSVSRDITVAALTDGTNMSIAGTAGARTLTGLRNGTIAANSADAVTGSQLNDTNTAVASNASSVSALTTSMNGLGTNFLTSQQRIASAFGGGSGVDVNGIVTTPSYTLFGGTYSNVGSALGAVETRTNTNTSDINSIWTQLGNGSVGLVQQSSITNDISIGAQSGGTNVSIAGTAGTRTLTGLRNGTIAANSADAVTGSQLNDTNTAVASNASSVSALTATVNGLGTNFLTSQQRIASAFGGGSGVDVNGIVTTPNYTLFGGTYSNVGSALGAVETRTNTNTSDINSIWTQLGNGSVGLVQQSSITNDISIGAQSGGTLINVTGTSGARKLTGLRDATLSAGSADAVTGSQLFDTNTAVASASSDLSALTSNVGIINTNFNTSQQRLASIFGGGATVDGNGVVTVPTYTILGGNYSSVGGALSALDARVQVNSINISNLMAGIGGGGGAPSLVVQDPSSRAITVAATTDGASVDLTGSTGARKITGVAAGNVSATSTDAVNGTQLAATNAAVANAAAYSSNSAGGLATALGGGASVDGSGNVTAPQYTVRNQTYNNVGSAIGAIDSRLSNTQTEISNVANSVSNITTSTRYLSINGRGRSAVASGLESVALGARSMSTGESALALGSDAVATAENAVALGNAAAATGYNAIAIGANAVATGSVALGVNTLASNGGAALGDSSVATGVDSAAVGPKATATAANAVAIGSGSIANVANTVSVGAPGNERRITNVAAGIDRTDAVNVGQLQDHQAATAEQFNEVHKRITKSNGGVAMAMALTGSSLPDNKTLGVAMNYGMFAGQGAIGISQYVRLNRNVVLSGGIGVQSNQVGGRAGLQVAW